MEFIASGAVLSIEQTQDEILKMEATWKRWGFGTFAVESKKSGTLLGAVGFSWHDFLPDVSPCVEIGWRLAKDEWNKGYATEAAHAALNHGLAQNGMSKIYSFCQTENIGSQRLADKLGMTVVNRVKSPTYDREILIYQNR